MQPCSIEPAVVNGGAVESNKGASVSLLTKSAGEDSIKMLCTKRLPNGRAIIYCDSTRTAMKAALAIHLTKFSYRYIEAYVHTDVDTTFALKGGEMKLHIYLNSPPQCQRAATVAVES